MRKFHGTKVLGTFAPEERKFHRTFRSLGANVPRNESPTGAKVLSMVFSLPGTKVQRNEKASYPQMRRRSVLTRFLFSFNGCPLVFSCLVYSKNVLKLTV